MRKLKIFLATLLAIVGASSMKAQEPYAALDGTTLTFYYDNLRSTRGTTYDLNTDGDPAWRSADISPYVTNVVFDSSFAGARPTTTKSWFCEMSKLETITGFESLNTSEITSMDQMFSCCSNLTSLDLSGWDVENVVYAIDMFAFCSSLQTIDLTGWKTTNLCNTTGMFKECSDLTTVYVSDDWTTERVTDSENSEDMFSECISLVGGNGTGYDPGHVDKEYARIDADGAPGYFTKKPEPYTVVSTDGSILTFYYDGMKSQRQGTKYNVPAGEYAPNWYFDNACANIETVVFDPSFANARPHYTYCWFQEMSKLSTITGMEYLNTSEVTNMGQMFKFCSKLTSLDLSGFDTKNVSNMAGMFHSCDNLVTIMVSSKWSTSKVTESDNMFTDCIKLKGGKGTTYDSENPMVDKTYARIDADDAPGYFTEKKAYAVLTFIENYDFYTLTFYYDANKSTFENDENVKAVYDIPWDNYGPEWTRDDVNSGIFYVTFDKSFKGYDGLTSTQMMFHDLVNLKEIENLPYLNTSNVENMNMMFSNCKELTSVDLSNFKTEKVKNMSGMFDLCFKLTSIDVSSFTTTNVENMGWMFWDCIDLKMLDLSNFITTNLKTTECMFADCPKLESVDLSSFDVSNVENMKNMFSGCKALTSLDLSNFDVSNVVEGNMSNMFSGCEELKTILCEEDADWNRSAEEIMFTNCGKLSGKAIGLSCECGHDENGFGGDYAKVVKEYQDGFFSSKTQKLTLNSEGYATYASELPIDFTKAEGFTGWIISGIEGENIIFEQIKGDAAPETGVLLMGAKDGDITITYTTNPGTDYSSTNKLKAITGGFTVVNDGDYYGLFGDQFVPIKAGLINTAGKAILPAEAVDQTGGTKNLNLVFNDETGIIETRTVSAEQAEGIFNLAGQRLTTPQRGINIVDGKKVLVK